MSILSERITKLRKERNLSAYAVEKGAGLTIGSLKNWNKSMPSADKILRVANFLDVSIDYLMGNCANCNSHKEIQTYNTNSDIQISEVMKGLSKTTSNLIAEAENTIKEILEQYDISPK